MKKDKETETSAMPPTSEPGNDSSETQPVLALVPRNSSGSNETSDDEAERPELVKSAKPRRSQAHPLQQYEEIVGGRQSIIENLQLGNLNKKAQFFLKLLCDPTKAKYSIVSLAADAELTTAQALELFRSSSFVRAQVMAMGKLAEALPEVAQDLAEKSIDQEIQCPLCRGEASEFVCQTCMGHGTIVRQGDIDHKKLLLEVAGIVKKGGGVNVQVNQNNSNNNGQPATFFSKYVRESDAAAYDVGDIIDVDPEKE
jgi:hypothetical protein